ncbi:MAG: DUF512 domain-containing protein [Acidimicrobiia bacterium]|nr:DUF512 domain-containing protein [Acidimicrobiia bacterium]MYG72227.1 DUF512 domain-containing protein [Acidimicrobiia bacterium]
MSAPRVTAVADGSVAQQFGLRAGDELLSVNGSVPKDVIEYQQLVDEPEVSLDVRRDGVVLELEVHKRAGEPLGAQVDSALFDRVRTCDNHCEFCFIYQLPPGLRPSLYLKDDDYRLSFLYGNFTTLTRFTEADLERVVTERLSPLNVSIHATDPDVRADMLRNRRGATSLRWLRALLDHGIEVHGQVVVCPDVNDGDVLEDTLAGVADEYPELASVCVVPLGVSRHTSEPRLRPHTRAEAVAVVEAVHEWQKINRQILGRRLVFAADEYYLLAGIEFPDPEAYEGFPMHEDGVGMATTLEMEFWGQTEEVTGTRAGFFAWVEGAPAEGYRAPRTDGSTPIGLRPRKGSPVGVITGKYGAAVLGPLVASLGRDDVWVVPVENRFFGGTTAVAGLLVGADIARTLAEQPEGHRYLLPDVCLSQGMFLDGTRPGDLPRPVEVVPTDGAALRRALDG